MLSYRLEVTCRSNIPNNELRCISNRSKILTNWTFKKRLHCSSPIFIDTGLKKKGNSTVVLLSGSTVQYNCHSRCFILYLVRYRIIVVSTYVRVHVVICDTSSMGFPLTRWMPSVGNTGDLPRGGFFWAMPGARRVSCYNTRVTPCSTACSSIPRPVVMWNSNIKAVLQCKHETIVCSVMWSSFKDSVLHPTDLKRCLCCIRKDKQSHVHSTSQRTSDISLQVTEWGPSEHIAQTSFVLTLTLASSNPVIKP